MSHPKWNMKISFYLVIGTSFSLDYFEDGWYFEGCVWDDMRWWCDLGFSTNFGNCSTYEVEIAAIAIGLEMAKELGINKLELQMDNKACVEVIQNANHHGDECSFSSS